MTPELALLKRFLTKKEFDVSFELVNLPGLREQDPKIHNLYVVLEILHRTIQADVHSLPDFEVFFYAQFPFMRDGEKDSYGVLFRQLGELDVSPSITSELLKSLAERASATRIARTALQVVEGRLAYQELQAEVSSAVGERLVEALAPLSHDLEELLTATYKTKGLRWRLPSLNARLGSLRKGDFGFVFARPETGKTTLLADQGAFMATQAKSQGLGPLLWFNNEEVGAKVLVRVYQATFQLQLPSLMAAMGAYTKRFAAEIGESFLLFDRPQLSRGDIEQAAAKYSPSLIIIDQIDKVHGFKADRNDLELGEIYIWARGLAKKYCPVIGVTQADGSGEGIKWLTMANVANAKTSKQAEADWILGVGKLGVEGYDSARYFHISKNKLFGDQDSDPALRHDRWEVRIKPEVARYEDL